eukprot:8566_1
MSEGDEELEQPTSWKVIVEKVRCLLKGDDDKAVDLSDSEVVGEAQTQSPTAKSKTEPDPTRTESEFGGLLDRVFLRANQSTIFLPPNPFTELNSRHSESISEEMYRKCSDERLAATNSRRSSIAQPDYQDYHHAFQHHPDHAAPGHWLM